MSLSTRSSALATIFSIRQPRRPRSNRIHLGIPVQDKPSYRNVGIQTDPEPDSSHQRLEISECKQDKDRILYKERQLIAPDPKEFTTIITKHHDHITAGHPGRVKTLEKIKENYVWEGMRKDIDRYVDNCETCQRTKPRRDKAFGLLNLLPVPSGIWKSMTLNYITGLSETQRYDAILVVVDRLSKMAHYVPTSKEVSAQEIAKLLLQHVWRYHGTPKEIISD